MRAVGVGVTDALDHCHVALIVQVLEGTHGRIEADVVVDAEHLLVRHPHRGAVVGVERVSVGDKGVHRVIAARELQYDEDRVFLG